MLVVKNKITRNIADNKLDYYKSKGYLEVEKTKEDRPKKEKE